MAVSPSRAGLRGHELPTTHFPPPVKRFPPLPERDLVASKRLSKTDHPPPSKLSLQIAKHKYQTLSREIKKPKKLDYLLGIYTKK